MASKITFLARVLDAYGPDAAVVRALPSKHPRGGNSTNVARSNAPPDRSQPQRSSR